MSFKTRYNRIGISVEIVLSVMCLCYHQAMKASVSVFKLGLVYGSDHFMSRNISLCNSSYRIYSRISRKIDDKIMPQKLGGDLSPGLY